MTLDVEGFEPAVVSLPIGAECPVPVLVATHGNYDRPEWQCSEWRDVVGNAAFIVCPRGKARGDSPSPSDVRFTYASNQELEREVDAALAALSARYGSRVAGGAVVYAGFSLGAIMGVAIASRAAERHPRLVLVEGGAEWTWARAKRFAEVDGARVLFACSQAGCRAAAREAVRKLRAVGVPTREIFVGGLGHSYGGALNEPIRQAWPWLVEGDPRWQGAPPR